MQCKRNYQHWLVIWCEKPQKITWSCDALCTSLEMIFLWITILTDGIFLTIQWNSTKARQMMQYCCWPNNFMTFQIIGDDATRDGQLCGFKSARVALVCLFLSFMDDFCFILWESLCNQHVSKGLSIRLSYIIEWRQLSTVKFSHASHFFLSPLSTFT